jgi:alanine racemase
MNKRIPYAHPAWVEVDLGQFKENLSAIRDFVPGKKLCIPIKANAYGHGLIPIAQAAQEVKVDYLAVSCLQEAVLLRRAAIRSPILIFGPIFEEQVPDFLRYELEVTLSSLESARLLAKALPEGRQIKVHVEVDTGMHRTGASLETIEEMLDFIDAEARIVLEGVYSHLATADYPDNDAANTQIAEFAVFAQTMRVRYPGALIHLCNSGGLLYYPDSHFDMVRPGKLIYGYSDAEQHITKPVFSVKASIAYSKNVKVGEGISYGHHYTTDKETRIVTVPVGYGDGYRRALTNKAEVLIQGKRYPAVGTICMDQFMVDVGSDAVSVGDEVVLIGRQGEAEILMEEISGLCDTIPSETLCNFNERLPHCYRDKNDVFWEVSALREKRVLGE